MSAPRWMRIASTLFVSLAASVSPAGAQTETLSASAISRVVVRTDRFPVNIADGRAGWVEFDLAAPVGGRPTGSMTLALGPTPGSVVTTEYQISGGTLRRNETDYEFLVELAAQAPTGASARGVSSRLTLARASRTAPSPDGVQHEDTWTVQRFADGDVLVMDGLKCQWGGAGWSCL
jgi:hypothetical protein